MSHTLRTFATCAVAFGLMAVVGNAARDTDASVKRGELRPTPPTLVHRPVSHLASHQGHKEGTKRYGRP